MRCVEEDFFDVLWIDDGDSFALITLVLATPARDHNIQRRDSDTRKRRRIWSDD
jgi:hypothetical protein